MHPCSRRTRRRSRSAILRASLRREPADCCRPAGRAPATASGSEHRRRAQRRRIGEDATTGESVHLQISGCHPRNSASRSRSEPADTGGGPPLGRHGLAQDAGIMRSPHTSRRRNPRPVCTSRSCDLIRSRFPSFRPSSPRATRSPHRRDAGGCCTNAAGSRRRCGLLSECRQSHVSSRRQLPAVVSEIHCEMMVTRGIDAILQLFRATEIPS